MTSVVHTARILAHTAHQKQRRKYTGEPYINHPENVVRILRNSCSSSYEGCRETLFAAAWLHDVLEDTEVTVQELSSAIIPVSVLHTVLWLTDPKPVEGKTRAQRKAEIVELFKSAPLEAVDIKLADIIDNTWSIVQPDAKFAEVYLREKRMLLEVLSKRGSTILVTIASDLLERAEAHLKLDEETRAQNPFW